MSSQKPRTPLYFPHMKVRGKRRPMNRRPRVLMWDSNWGLVGEIKYGTVTLMMEKTR